MIRCGEDAGADCLAITAGAPPITGAGGAANAANVGGGAGAWGAANVVNGLLVGTATGAVDGE